MTIGDARAWTIAKALTKTLPNALVALEGDQNAVRKMAGDILLAKVCAHTLNQTLGQITNGATNIGAVSKNQGKRRFIPASPHT